MRKWIKYIAICLAITILLVLSHADYYVIQIGNKWYLQMDRSFYFDNYGEHVPPYSQGMRNNSFQEIKQGILLSKDDVQCLRQIVYEENRDFYQLHGFSPNGLIPMLDLNSLYEPKYPSSFSDSGYSISWSNETYSMGVRNEDGIRYGVSFLGQEEYDKTIDKYLNYKNYLEKEKYRIYEVIYEADRNATGYIYSQNWPDAEIKKILIYQFTNGNITYTVVERYDLRYSSSRPYYVLMYAIIDKKYISMGLSCPGFSPFSERPSVEYLSQFGIQKYEG